MRLVGRGLTGTAALTKARSLYPRLLAEYQAGDTAPVPSAEVAKAEAVVAFDRLVDRIATERGVPLTTAMVIFRPARASSGGEWLGALVQDRQVLRVAEQATALLPGHLADDSR